MARIKIPWLIDVVTVSDARDVQALGTHPSLERNLERTGPLFNRLLLGRILSTFQVDEQPLPAFRARSDENRQVLQEDLRRELTVIVDNQAIDNELLKPAAEFVAGRGDRDEAMEHVCRLLALTFDPQGVASAGGLWRDAQIISAAVRPFSVRGFFYRLTGQHHAARGRILKAVAGKPNGLHAIAITTANIAETLEKLRTRYVAVAAGDRSMHAGLASLWLHVRTAPETLFRRPKATMSLPVTGDLVTTNTLILLRARKGQRAEPPIGYAFMAQGWSSCPAAGFVQQMCWQIWQIANEEKDTAGTGK